MIDFRWRKNLIPNLRTSCLMIGKRSGRRMTIFLMMKMMTAANFLKSFRCLSASSSPRAIYYRLMVRRSFCEPLPSAMYDYWEFFSQPREGIVLSKMASW
ncbi:hypothetical protein A2V82_14495 [candidate division KSB1 bacterium RBG_16_48_16]|nr:MAG: hypothetical protein A2V82_14495 [candidate division KSB1 bacterium RBG_16_48_16]